jgi:DNA-binding response OmpR family regulator
MRLLVAEDDAKLRDVLTRGLTQAGYTVDATMHGDEAYAFLMRDVYDIAVVDWRMRVAMGSILSRCCAPEGSRSRC